MDKYQRCENLSKKEIGGHDLKAGFFKKPERSIFRFLFEF